MWLAYACGSAFFAGICAILAKVGIKRTDSTLATAIRTVVILLFAWMMVVVTNCQNAITQLNFHTMLYLILSGLATGASWLCYFKALQLGDVNKVTPIDKSSTVLTIILGVVLLGETWDRNKIIAAVAIAVGTILMITKQKAGKASKNGTWLIYATLSAVFASLTAILSKIGIQDVPSNLGTAIRTTVVLVMAWMMVFIGKKQKQLRTITFHDVMYIALSGIATGVSWMFYYRALQLGEAGIVVPIDRLSIVVTIVFSSVFLNEKLSKKAFFGLLLIVAGTLLLICNVDSWNWIQMQLRLFTGKFA
jgi:transporter family protein